MIHAAALEMVGKVKGVARALPCLHTGAILSLMPGNQIARPRAVRFRGLF